jgi:hypothetical protein
VGDRRVVRQETGSVCSTGKWRSCFARARPSSLCDTALLPVLLLLMLRSVCAVCAACVCSRPAAKALLQEKFLFIAEVFEYYSASVSTVDEFTMLVRACPNP